MGRAIDEVADEVGGRKLGGVSSKVPKAPARMLGIKSPATPAPRQRSSAKAITNAIACEPTDIVVPTAGDIGA